MIDRALGAPVQVEETLSLEQLAHLQETVDAVYVDPALVRYAQHLAAATRDPDRGGLTDIAQYVEYGVSPRGPINLALAARALAVLRGRRYAVPSDLVELAKDVFRHRIVLSYEAIADDATADDVLDRVLAAVSTPDLEFVREERRRRERRSATSARTDTGSPRARPAARGHLRKLDLTVRRRVDGLPPATTGRRHSVKAPSWLRFAPT